MIDHAARAVADTSVKHYAERFHSYPRAVARSMGTRPRLVKLTAEQWARTRRTGVSGWFDDTSWALRQRRVPAKHTKRNAKKRARLLARARGAS